MADILIDDVVKELGEWIAHNPNVVAAGINAAEITLDKHTKPITKINGKYPSSHSLMTNLVQGFTSKWTPMGQAQITHKLLQDYHQKVNFPFKPTDVLHSYYAGLYTEDKKKEDTPIAKHIFDDLVMPKVIDDIETLDIIGKYDPEKLKQFGFSMNGVEALLDILLAVDPAANNSHTPFKIPINAFTDTNMVDEVTSFERKIPYKTKRKIKKIYISENNAERYQIDYEYRYGQNTQFQKDSMKTKLGKRQIVALPGMSSDLIFATPDENFVKLIDVFHKPKVTDIQKLDYEVKLFMEWWRGLDFLINEMVYISNFEDATYGLGSKEKNQLYYGIDGVTPAE